MAVQLPGFFFFLMPYTTLSPTDVCNVALAKIGAQAIVSLSDPTNSSALACNNNFPAAYLEVSRAAPWNCLLNLATLASIVQTPIAPAGPPITFTPWAPNTAYLANVYLSFGGYVYQVLFNFTSSASFLNDLTTGAMVQTDQPVSANPIFPPNGSGYPSGWSYQYQLPADFELLVALNDNTTGYGNSFVGVGTSDYQIIGQYLYANDSTATIQYVSNVIDTTRWDPMLLNCVTLKLASAVSTLIRQDGGVMERTLLMGYEDALKKARRTNGGEQQARRFNPILSSKFNRARFAGSNG